MKKKQKSHSALKIFYSHFIWFFFLLSPFSNKIIFSICHSSLSSRVIFSHITHKVSEVHHWLWCIKGFFYRKTNNKVIEKTIKKTNLSACISNLMEIQRKCRRDNSNNNYNNNWEEKNIRLLRANRQPKRWINDKNVLGQKVCINQLIFAVQKGRKRKRQEASQTVYVKSLSNFRFVAHCPCRLTESSSTAQSKPIGEIAFMRNNLHDKCHFDYNNRFYWTTQFEWKWSNYMWGL